MESRPVFIHYSFGYHTEEEVAFLPRIKQEALDLYRKAPSGRNIYIHEDAGGTKAALDQHRKLYRDTKSHLSAFLQAWALSQPGNQRHLTPEELKRGRAFMLAIPTPITGDPNMDAYLAQGVFVRHELITIDQITQELGSPLIYDPESYKPNVAAQIAFRMSQKRGFMQTAYQNYQQGDVDGVAQNTTQAILLQRQLYSERNKNINQKMVDQADEALNRNQATKIFVRIGEDHDGLLKLPLKTKHPPSKIAITYNYDYDEPLRLPLSQLSQAEEPVTDDQALTAFLGEALRVHLSNNTDLIRPELYSLATRVISLTSVDRIGQLIADYPRVGDRALENLVNNTVFA